MRLTGAAGGRFLRFQDEMIGEYYNGALVQRFIPGEGTDETVGAFNGSGAFTWFYADERGSTVARADSSGVAQFIHSYDEYGRPTGNAPRIGFTGQLMLSFGQLYDFRNRFYHAGVGRFLQTNPISYGGGMNLYAYVKGDPVNFVDPLGLQQDEPDIIVNGKKLQDEGPSFTGGAAFPAANYGWGPTTYFGDDTADTDNGLADGKPFSEQTEEQQRKNCKTNDNVARGLSTPSVRTRAAEALAADLRTYWEWGFWTAPKGSGTHAFGLGTSRAFGWMDPNDAYPWMVSRIWHGTGAPNVMYHTHNSGGGLSREDVNWARDTKNSIVAIGGKNVYYCYPG